MYRIGALIGSHSYAPTAHITFAQMSIQMLEHTRCSNVGSNFSCDEAVTFTPNKGALCLILDMCAAIPCIASRFYLACQSFTT